MSSTAPKVKKIKRTTVRFMGPAQTEFNTLQEQSIYFLNYFWSNWNNCENPKSYIIPPSFTFKHEDVSDEAFELFKQGQEDLQPRNPHAVITDRIGDEAEHLVYKAIEEIIDDGIQAPFIAIHSLNVKNLIKHLKNIFPEPNWTELLEQGGKAHCFREYDFLLIGPKIGFIAIEVKSSKFEKAFRDEIQYLPEDYQKAIDEQLASVDQLLSLMEICFGCSIPDKNFFVQKIIFTPNLEKDRYINWLSRKCVSDRECIRNKVGNVIQWFKSDLTGKPTKSTDKPPFYSKLKHYLENCNTTITQSTYEVIATILSSLASITMLSSKGVVEYSLDISENKTISAVDTKVSFQKPFEVQKYMELASASQLKAAPELVVADGCTTASTIFKLFFLSPDQQKALNGHVHQFIMGAAGTGKTVILQTKAIQLLAKQESIVVLAAGAYGKRYKKLFDEYGYKSYKIFDLTDQILDIVDLFNDCPFAVEKETILNDLDNYIDSKQVQKHGLVIKFGNIFRGNHVIIDDAFDPSPQAYATNLCDTFPLFMIVLISKYCPDKHVWIAVDVFKKPKDATYNDQYVTIVQEHLLLARKMEHQSRFSVTVLQQVMRCSANIYQAVYEFGVNLAEDVMPALGHKISGIKFSRITKHCKSFDDALLKLWSEVDGQIRIIMKDGFNPADIAIIFDLIVADDTLQSFLKEQLELNWPAIAPTKDDHEMTGQDTLLPESTLPVNTTRLILVEAHEVSSFEWPVVIFVNLLAPYMEKFVSTQYFTYRAMSRATSRLFHICLTYEEKLYGWKRDDLCSLIEICKQNQIRLRSVFNKSKTQFKESLQDPVWKKIHDEYTEITRFRSYPEQSVDQIRELIRNIKEEAVEYAEMIQFQITDSPDPPKPASWVYDMFEILYEYTDNGQIRLRTSDDVVQRLEVIDDHNKEVEHD